MCSTMSITPPRSSTCTISATSTRGCPILPSPSPRTGRPAPQRALPHPPPPPFLWEPVPLAPTTTRRRPPKFLGGPGHGGGGMLGGSGRFDGAQGNRFPSLTEPDPAYHGLKFYENFGDFAFTTKARAV